MDINGKTAVITGGASGLGKEMANLMLEKKANVAILDINLELLEKNSQGLESILAIHCDITDELSVSKAVNKVLEKFGTVDILINNAGILYSEPLINILSEKKRHSLDSWKKVLDLNLTGTFIVSSFIAEHMVMSRRKGIIINISSICSNGNAGQSAYSASKAGVESLTKVWAKELGIHGIRSVAIAPGFIDTESTHKAISKSAIDTIKSEIPIRRLGKSENVSHAIIFAIENDYINGKVIEVDGGMSI